MGKGGGRAESWRGPPAEGRGRGGRLARALAAGGRARLLRAEGDREARWALRSPGPGLTDPSWCPGAMGPGSEGGCRG